MMLTEKQIQTIVSELKERLNAKIEDPNIESAEPFEDEYGNCYSCGSHTDKGMFEDVLCNEQKKLGLKEEDEVLIDCEYIIDCGLYFEPYDPGDYWNPPCGGDVEVTESEGYIHDLDIEINVYDPETEKYDSMEINQKILKRIEDAVNA